MNSAVEKCSLIIVGRDRYSPTFASIDSVLRETPGDHEVIVVLGKAPARKRRELESRYGGRVRFLFEDRFLNPAQARNLGLKAASCRLSVLMDNDVRVLPGWLEPLVRCQAETGAAMVVPNILEGPRYIHTAGNDLFISYRGGKPYGRKTLRFHKFRVDEGTNLKRQPTDYGELHLQLVETRTALDLAVYDEKIQEVGEVDAGLSWAKGGKKMYFEPASVVIYDIPARLDDPDDVRFFEWRWSVDNIAPGYLHFKKKWGMDISDQGDFKTFLVSINAKVGLWPRLWPCRATLWIDHRLADLGRLMQAPFKAWKKLKAKRLGWDRWVRAVEESS